MSLATSSPGAQTPKTPQASCGPFSPGRRSCVDRPSPRATCLSLPQSAGSGGLARRPSAGGQLRRSSSTATMRGEQPEPAAPTTPRYERRAGHAVVVAVGPRVVVAETRRPTPRTNPTTPPVARNAGMLRLSAGLGWHVRRATRVTDPRTGCTPSAGAAAPNQPHDPPLHPARAPTPRCMPSPASSPPPPDRGGSPGRRVREPGGLARARRRLHRHRRHPDPGQGVGRRTTSAPTTSRSCSAASPW